MDVSRFHPSVGHPITGLHRFRRWTLPFFIVVISVPSCYLWIDRPIAFWVHAHQPYLPVRDELGAMGRFPNPLTVLAAILFFVAGFARLAAGRLNHLQHVILVCSTSVLVGEVSKDLFKWLFGRASPELWAAANISPYGTYEYHFHWFHGAEPFNSFPSGHMTAAAAVLTVLWICYPWLRLMYAACGALVGTALVGFNFHFIGDVIAGGLLGSTVALLVLAHFERSMNARQSTRSGTTNSGSIIPFRQDRASDNQALENE